jgi:hypothetical protein
VDDTRELDSEVEESPLSIADVEPVKRSKVSETANSQSWLEEDDIVDSDV